MCQSSYNTLGDFIMYALKCGMTNWKMVWAASGLASFLFSERISLCVSAQKTAKPTHISPLIHSTSLHRSHRFPLLFTYYLLYVFFFFLMGHTSVLKYSEHVMCHCHVVKSVYQITEVCACFWTGAFGACCACPSCSLYHPSSLQME